MSDNRSLSRAAFPDNPFFQVRGMAAQANTWFLIQMDEQELTVYEALYIAHELLNTVILLIGKEEQKAHKAKAARKAKQKQHLAQPPSGTSPRAGRGEGEDGT